MSTFFEFRKYRSRSNVPTVRVSKVAPFRLTLPLSYIRFGRLIWISGLEVSGDPGRPRLRRVPEPPKAFPLAL